VYLLLLGLGGVVFPLTKFPDSVRPVLELLPITALTEGMRSVLENGAGFPAGPVIVLACWTVAGLGLAARTFRWE
jgi:ABC-2 type transport system permease protein